MELTPRHQQDRLHFAVLGPVRVHHGETMLDPGTPQQRAVLATLLLRAGRVATTSEVIDAVWGEEAPSGAVGTLRTYAFRLRKLLGDDVLSSEGGGYALRLDPEQLDLTRSQDLAADAEKAQACGELKHARELLGRALEPFEGEPLAGVPGPYAEAQRGRIAEWRIGLTERRCDLDLRLGRHADIIAELTALCAEHPFRERLRALLMLALYRSERQAEALGVYADTRRLLADELGVDPGGYLADLHQRVLRGDPELAAPAADAEPHAQRAGWVRPAQLPAAVADFTGRDAVVRTLGERLTAQGGARALAISAVAGIGGVGKTTLAVHVAHAVREEYPDGQLYVDLRGQGAQALDPEAVLASFLRALGVADGTIPDSLAERAALYRSTLAGRRVLVLLDNARDAPQVRELLPGSPQCAVVVTSRGRMAELPGAHLVTLDAMSPDEALALFTRIVGADRVEPESAAAREVVAACGCLPLAIRIAGSRLAARRSGTVAALAERLADERRRLDRLKVGELEVTASFQMGYGQLEPAQARAFRLLALPDGPDLSLASGAALLDLDAFDAEELLDSLVDMGMLESPTSGRYRYHDLLRLFARGRAERDEPEVEQTAALRRLFDFLLATAGHAYQLENPGDRLVDHLVAPGYAGATFPSRAESLDWLFQEADCLLALVRQGARAGGDLLSRAADLLLVTQDLSESGAHDRSYEQATRVVVDEAEARQDNRAEGRARTMRSQVLQLAGLLDESVAEADRALLPGRRAGDPISRAYAPNQRGVVALYRNQLADAEECFTVSLRAFQEDGNRVGEASILGNLARVYVERGEPERAVRVAERVLDTFRELGASLRLGTGLYALGIALHAAGRYEDAMRRQREALTVFRAERQRLWEGMTIYRAACTELCVQRPGRAADLAERALVLFCDIGGAWRRGLILTVLSRALDQLGQTDRARACRDDALALFDVLGAPEAEQLRAEAHATDAGEAPTADIAVVGQRGSQPPD